MSERPSLPPCPALRPSSTCRWTPTCPTTTCPTSRRSWSCTDGWDAWSRTEGLAECGPSWSIASGRCRQPAERLLEVARLRFTAERAGIISVAREEGQLVVRFPPGWSRAATARALAPRSGADPLRAVAGGLDYGSNQIRVRLPAEGATAWRVTRELVERLAAAAGDAA